MMNGARNAHYDHEVRLFKIHSHIDSPQNQSCSPEQLIANAAMDRLDYITRMLVSRFDACFNFNDWLPVNDFGDERDVSLHIFHFVNFNLLINEHFPLGGD